MQQCLEVGDLFLVPHAQLAIVIHPGMRPLHHPASSASFGLMSAFARRFGWNMQAIASRPYLLCRRFAFVALVHTEVLRPSSGWLRPSDHDRVQRLGQQLHVVPIGPVDDKRQRGATAVHQQAALGPFFFPDPSGCSPPPPAPTELCLASRPGFAIPTRCLPFRRIRPAPPATAARKIPAAATFGNGDESRWRCQNSWAGPSIGSRCAAHTRWPQKFPAAQWACARPQGLDGSGACARHAEIASAPKVRPETKARRILPMIGLSAWANHGGEANNRQIVI
jgi:hypothetical protein